MVQNFEQFQIHFESPSCTGQLCTNRLYVLRKGERVYSYINNMDSLDIFLGGLLIVNSSVTAG